MEKRLLVELTKDKIRALEYNLYKDLTWYSDCGSPFEQWAHQANISPKLDSSSIEIYITYYIKYLKDRLEEISKYKNMRDELNAKNE